MLNGRTILFLGVLTTSAAILMSCRDCLLLPYLILVSGLIFIRTWILFLNLPLPIVVGDLEIPEHIWAYESLEKYVEAKDRSWRFFWKQFAPELLRKAQADNPALFASLHQHFGIPDCLVELVFTQLGTIPEENSAAIVELLQIEIALNGGLSGLSKEMLRKIFVECDPPVDGNIKREIEKLLPELKLPATPEPDVASELHPGSVSEISLRQQQLGDRKSTQLDGI